MDDGERAVEIDRLLERLSEATKQKAALVSEAEDFAAMIGQIRTAFGNPYFYSGGNRERPEHAEESRANYTGSNSHDLVLPTVLAIVRVDGELRAITQQLRTLGVTVD